MKYDYIDLRNSDLSASARLVAAMLLGRTKAGSVRCWPGLNRLAKDTGLSRSSVIRALQQLEHARWIKIERRRRTTNIYTLLKPWGQTEDKSVDNESLRCHSDTQSDVTVTPKDQREDPRRLMQERWQVEPTASHPSKGATGSAVERLAKAWEADRES